MRCTARVLHIYLQYVIFDKKLINKNNIYIYTYTRSPAIVDYDVMHYYRILNYPYSIVSYILHIYVGIRAVAISRYYIDVIKKHYDKRRIRYNTTTTTTTTTITNNNNNNKQ